MQKEHCLNVFLIMCSEFFQVVGEQMILHKKPVSLQSKLIPQLSII